VHEAGPIRTWIDKTYWVWNSPVMVIWVAVNGVLVDGLIEETLGAGPE